MNPFRFKDHPSVLFRPSEKYALILCLIIGIALGFAACSDPVRHSEKELWRLPNYSN